MAARKSSGRAPQRRLDLVGQVGAGQDLLGIALDGEGALGHLGDDVERGAACGVRTSSRNAFVVIRLNQPSRDPGS